MPQCPKCGIHICCCCNHTPRLVKRDLSEEPKIHNPHLVEDNERWRVEGFNQGHMVSRFIAPSSKNY